MKEPKKSNLKNRGKKGGTRFPNNSLKQILPFIKEFVSKTHIKPISMEQMNAGVFKVRTKSAEGQVKFSSMKQFGLAQGEYKEIKQTDLTSNIGTADEKELIKYYQTAFLNVPTFKNTFETFQFSTTNKTKLKAYGVSSLKVHPDSADRFINSLVESAEIAQLCIVKGEEITFISSKEVNDNSIENDLDAHLDEISDNENNQNLEENGSAVNDDNSQNHGTTGSRNSEKKFKNSTPNIELKIDPTLDPDKLEKQLKILRKFGLI